ncbi:MAG: DNA-deoxyinosine glycosylase [Gammaproteobacteria bacterium]
MTSSPAPISLDERIHGFPPLVGERPKVLILGSMPSVASLAKHQYYGKAQNAFWPIMGELFGAGPSLTYEERTRVLADKGIAIWDVLSSCVRAGSLDSAIQRDTEITNDLAGLLSQHSSIGHVFFNGRKAEQVYHRRVRANIDQFRPDIVYACLPSTSPAMATLDFAAKLQKWQAVGRALRETK